MKSALIDAVQLLAAYAQSNPASPPTPKTGDA
jgi:hypothetical protein